MAGTIEGGKKAAATNKEKYGPDFYRDIGRKGGRASHGGGFASMSHEQISAIGSKGGSVSRRGKAIPEETKELIWKALKNDEPPSLIAEQFGVSVGSVYRIKRKGIFYDL